MSAARRGYLPAADRVGFEPRDGSATDRVTTAPDRLAGDVRRALYRASTILAFAALPVVLTLAIIGASFVRGPFLYDFNGGLYQAGNAIVNGRSPYHATYVERRASLNRSHGSDAAVLSVPVYPPPVLLAAVPFSLLPYRVAGVLFTVLSIAGLIGGLYFLGARDWRCFGVAFASWPVLHGLMLGGLTPVLVLAVGLAWRWRTRVAATGLAVAAVITAKLFPWPLFFWLVTTRRLRAAALVAAMVIIGTISAWAAIGFAGMSDYPHMLAGLDSLSAGAGVSLVAGLLAVGLHATVAHILALTVASMVLVAAWLARRSPDADRRAMGLAVVAALIASPIAWPHYFALLFVPIALSSPRLSPLWFAPLLAWLAPVAQSTGHPWAIVPYLAIIALLSLRLCMLGGRAQYDAYPSPAPSSRPT
jgi:Glycosyltransferase family 87